MTKDELRQRARELRLELAEVRRQYRLLSWQEHAGKHADLHASYAGRLQALSEGQWDRAQAAASGNVVPPGPGETGEDVDRRRARIRALGGLSV